MTARLRMAAPVLTLALAAGAALAQGAGQPLLRVQVQPHTAVVGQPVKVGVEVLVPNWFLSEPKYPQLEISGAVAILPDETPVNSSERIGGTNYSSIKRTYLVYPQKPGAFTLPPSDVVVTYALQGGTPSQPTSLPLPPQTFEAAIPAEAAGLGYFLPTTQLALTQSVDPPLQGLKVGSTFTRTVTATAAQTFAMFIPPVRFECPDGLRVYPKDPVVVDEKETRAGFLGGRRVDSATYLVDKPGTYTLPGISVTWWDLDAGKLRTAALPPVTFIAAPNPDYKPALAPEPEPAAVAAAPAATRRAVTKRRVLEAGIALAVVLVLLWLARRYGRAAISALETWRRDRAEGEPACFSKLLGACRSGDPKATYSALALWVQRSGAGGQDHTIAAFAARWADPALRGEIGRLGSLLYSREKGDARWDGRPLGEGLERARRAKKAEAGRRSGRHGLPELNPEDGGPR